MLRRDLDTMARRAHDVVIVGGGIHGAAAAWEAASRGLSVALLEADDFGAGVSWNSLKTIHGGLRHLALNVRDLAGMTRFYVDLLGFAVEWQPDADNIYLSSGIDNLALHRASAFDSPLEHPHTICDSFRNGLGCLLKACGVHGLSILRTP